MKMNSTFSLAVFLRGVGVLEATVADDSAADNVGVLLTLIISVAGILLVKIEPVVWVLVTAVVANPELITVNVPVVVNDVVAVAVIAVAAFVFAAGADIVVINEVVSVRRLSG